MLEFHGWLTIYSTPGESDSELEDDTVALDRTRALISQLRTPPGLADIRVVNGQAQWHFGGNTNHRTQDIEDLLDALREISHTAPGSYGLVYLRDDEDRAGGDNEFSVLVVTRGQVLEHKDPFLSPVVPVIEDPAE